MGTTTTAKHTGGDFALLQGLYRAHAGAVSRWIAARGLPTHDIPDAVQDTFLVVHRQLETFDFQRPIRPWLFGIAWRVAALHKRRAAKRHERLHIVPAPARIPPADASLSRAEAAEVVEMCLAELDEAKRIVFVMSDVDGLTAPEIATAIGISESAVRSRLKRARRSFERAASRLMSREGLTP